MTINREYRGVWILNESQLDELIDRCLNAEQQLAERTAELQKANAKFTEHTEHVAFFLNELYAIMVDPLAEGVRKVSETTAALLEAARRDRNTGRLLHEAEAELERARAQIAKLTK